MGRKKKAERSAFSFLAVAFAFGLLHNIGEGSMNGDRRDRIEENRGVERRGDRLRSADGAFGRSDERGAESLSWRRQRGLFQHLGRGIRRKACRLRASE